MRGIRCWLARSQSTSSDMTESDGSIVEVLTLWSFPAAVARDLDANFRVWPGANGSDLRSSIEMAGDRIRGIATKGSIPISIELLDLLPRLEIVSSYTAGGDGIPKRELARRGIRLANASSALAADVAELAIGLALSGARRLLEADRFVRKGAWAIEEFPLTSRLAGKRSGIIGLGTIGREIASRCIAFGMDVGYVNRSEVQAGPYHRFSTPVEVAEWTDILFICCPGGPENSGIIDRHVLDALGPLGILVNVARGSVVNEPELLSALTDRRIGFAALDVVQNEPHPDPSFFSLGNVLLTPHVGSSTIEARAAMGRAVVQNLVQHFDAQVTVQAFR